MGSSAPASQGGDLFGPDPGSDPLAYYAPPDPAADIFAGADPAIARHWRNFAAGLATQCQGNFAALQDYLDRHVEDLGLAFRLTGDEQERAWPLNPMPLIIGAQEWAGIEAGLVQRADLLERVIADIYGPQRLIGEGHLPAAAVSGSANFARRMVGLKPPRGHYLHVIAMDLARGPTGDWRVLADRVRLPVGIGYALENRQAIGRATGGLLAAIGTRRQMEFFDQLRQGIAAHCHRAEPRIGLLTPGRFNQSYPEQAHLARQLGFSLVEGRDLVVRDDRLFVRTIAGLKRIDALWRWIGARNIDPLNFAADSQIGVPNLISACAAGLPLANWPGVGVVESRAMPAFLPRLAKVLLGTELLLPNVATWWCGGEAERSHVLANLGELVVSSAFRQPVPGLPAGRTRPGASFSPAERAELEQAIHWRPMDYTAQEIVSLSTMPALANGHFEPRGFTLRAFLARDETGNWCVLPGGFARVSETGDLRTSLMGLGDISTDVCIVDEVQGEQSVATLELAAPPVRRELGLLPSQAADNLYWIGRYVERASQVGNIVRALIDQVPASGGLDPGTTVARLCALLRRLGATPRKSKDWPPIKLATAALGDSANPGAVAALAASARQIARLLRDRLSRDSWRVINRPLPPFDPEDAESIADACDLLIERFASVVDLAADSMSRSPAWRFFDLGIAIERASVMLQAAQAMVPGSASAEDLAALLDLVDGQARYRSRYLAMPFIAPVLDMVLLDPAEPRGFAFQAERIAEHLAALPVVRQDGLPEAPLLLARQMRAQVEALEATALGGAQMEALRASLAGISEAIEARYFLHEERAGAGQRSGLLG